MTKKGLVNPDGSPMIKDDNVNLNQGKVIDLNNNKPNVFIEVTTSNKELVDKVGQDNLAKMFVPLAQVMTQFSEATNNKEMIVAFKNVGSKLNPTRTMGIRFIHGDRVKELLGDDYIKQFFPEKEDKEKANEQKEDK